MSKPPRLRVIQGTKPPDTLKERVRGRLRAHAKPAALLQCPRCGGRELIETKIGVSHRNGKPSGGKKHLLCATCLMKGERVVVAF